MMIPRRTAVPLLLLLSVALPGCANGPAALILRSEQRNATFSQVFDQAFAGQTDDGSQAFILIANEAQQARPADLAQPLRPVERAPLRQLVYIKVLWRPSVISVRDAPETANAALDWYVFSEMPGSGPGERATEVARGGGGGDVLHYQGSGFVTVKAKGDVTLLNIQRSRIRPQLAEGLTDPVGRASVEGQVIAVNDPERVRELLAATRERAAVIARGREPQPQMNADAR